MPSVVATIRVKEDKIEDAKAFLKDLAKSVLENEPGTLIYQFHQRTDEPTTFIAYEKYRDEESFNLHGKNLAAHGAAFAGIMAGPPEIVTIEEI